jgi:hypothetical protein
MKTLHRAMMGVLMTGVLALGFGTFGPWAGVLEAQHGEPAQHGHADSPMPPFEHVADALELTAAQRESLEQPFAEAVAAMQQLHHQHEVIAAQLTDAQKEKFATLVHQMMGMEHGDARAGEHHQ